jgi:hypothetical protein
MVMKVFGNGNESMQIVAVQLLSQIPGPLASLWLDVLAVDSTSAIVRGLAAEALVPRDPRDVVGRLIARVRKPYQYEVKPALGPGSVPALIVDGRRFDIQSLDPTPRLDVGLLPPVDLPPLPPIMSAPSGSNQQQLYAAAFEMSARIALFQAQQRRMMLAAAVEDTRRRDEAMQRTLENQIQLLDDLNARTNETNRRALPILQVLTGRNFGPEVHAWQKWWSGELGLASPSGPSSSQTAAAKTAAASDAPAAPNAGAPTVAYQACLAAGTLVHSIDGLRPVESIHVGDLVLSQETTSGELTFSAVVAVHRGQPAPTLSIALDDHKETIVATGIQNFWKMGNGWRMARDLKAGDHLRMLGDVVSIESIKPDKTQPVYNLDVADNRNFLMGKAGLLVHDFTFVQPVLAPFDRLPELDVSLNPRSK